MAEEHNTIQQIITTKGQELLAKSSVTGANQTYWLGYFGFAYVPDEARTEGDDKLSSAMTRLTTKGDMIYNIWQGSMTPNGNQTDVGSSNAFDLYSQCQYTNNITSNFRYAIKDGKNTLTLYIREDNGKVVKWGDSFEGVSVGVGSNNAVVNSNLPIPAPLFYQGNDTPTDLQVSGDPRHYDGNENLWHGSEDEWNRETLRPVNTCKDNDIAKTYISNFNKYHAPAISDGYMVGKEPSCRNMATVTKYFPVAHYDVESTEGSKVSALKLKLVVNLNNIASKVADRTNYANPQTDDSDNNNDLNLDPVGFKFNRIGIYAVPMAVHQYSYEEPNCQRIAERDIQYQVIGDAEPELFAVVDLDQVVTVEEGGSISEWTVDFVVNIAGSGNIESNPVVYYNLYEDDSIVWYKNQLIANASSAEAVTNLGIEMNYLKNQIENIRSGESCGMGDSGDQYALVGHTHPYFKNLSDVGDSSIVNTAAIGRWTGDSNPIKFQSDILAFVGDKSSKYAKPNWYGIGNNLAEIGETLHAEDSTIPSDAALQSERSPMLLTGGLALGGYGDDTSNFMLLRIGSDIAADQTNWPELSYDRNGVLQNPCMWIPSKNVVTTDVSEPNKFLVTYNEDGDGVKHLTTKSPYAGHVLMVMDDQEIDGTLHVGLGMPAGHSYSVKNMKTISIMSKYVSPNMVFTIEYDTPSGHTMKTLNMKCPFFDNPGTDNQTKPATVRTDDGIIKFDAIFKYHTDAHTEMINMDIWIDPQDSPLNVYMKRSGEWTDVTEHNNNAIYLRGMQNDCGQLVMLNMCNNWYRDTSTGGQAQFTIYCPGFETRGEIDGHWHTGVGANGRFISIPEVSDSTGSTVAMMPVSAPGYYRNLNEYVNPIRINQANMSTIYGFDGDLPYLSLDNAKTHGDNSAF